MHIKKPEEKNTQHAAVGWVLGFGIGVGNLVFYSIIPVLEMLLYSKMESCDMNKCKHFTRIKFEHTRCSLGQKEPLWVGLGCDTEGPDTGTSPTI